MKTPIEINLTHLGNAIKVLKSFPDESVDCCVTSPPYWGLRDYGLEPQIWDDDQECNHIWGNSIRATNSGGGWRDPEDEAKRKSYGMRTVDTAKLIKKDVSQGQFCSKCNVWKGSFGLEPTPELYIQHLIQIFREVKRVLKKTGTLWLNLGDSYAGGGRAGNNPEHFGKHKMFGKDGWDPGIFGKPQKIPYGLKAKDLVGIPWMAAFALRADGWYLRSDIIWHKPNPMPESVTDRPTKSHEYIFLLTKNQKYYYDAVAIKVPSVNPKDDRGSRQNRKRFPTEKINGIRNSGIYPTTNKRSVWTINTKPCLEAHFAVYPEELIRDCIKAGCPKYTCPECDKPRIPIYKTVQEINKWDNDYWWNFLLGTSHSNRYYKEVFEIMKDWMIRNKCYDYQKFYDWWLLKMQGNWKSDNLTEGQSNKLKELLPFPAPESRLKLKIDDYTDCGCGAEFVPGIVLDPFHGSGTTGIVARKLNCSFIGIELNKEYIEIENKRSYKELGIFK